MLNVMLQIMHDIVERKKGDSIASGTQRKKKLEKQEEQLKNYNKDLTMVNKMFESIVMYL